MSTGLPGMCRTAIAPRRTVDSSTPTGQSATRSAGTSPGTSPGQSPRRLGATVQAMRAPVASAPCIASSCRRRTDGGWTSDSSPATPWGNWREMSGSKTCTGSRLSTATPAHPHVHIQMAAKRQGRDRELRTLQLTRPRLARMKATIDHELTSQREARRAGRQALGRKLQRSSRHLTDLRATRTQSPEKYREAMNDLRKAVGLPRWESVDRGHERRERISSRIGRLAARLANHYKIEMERAVRERKWSSEHDWDDGRGRHRGRGRGRGD